MKSFSCESVLWVVGLDGLTISGDDRQALLLGSHWESSSADVAITIVSLNPGSNTNQRCALPPSLPVSMSASKRLV